MRQIGSLSPAQNAQVFADYLVSQGISAHSEQDGDQWTLWVRDENDVESAKGLLSDYRQNPSDARYRDVSRVAEKIRREEEDRRRKATRNTIGMRQQWNRPAYRRAPLVMTLIVASVVASLFANFGSNPTSFPMRMLSFCDVAVYLQTRDGLAQIRAGQIWRVVTPIFLHGGPMHLVFNMYWLYLFGVQIESRRGALRLAGIVLAIAALSNLAQFYLEQSPQFYGMSGVVYGLLGYLWIRQRIDPASGFQLSQGTFMFLIFFMFLGFTHLLDSVVGPIANYAHAGGLVAGMAIAYMPLAFKSV